jgi:hypothetical protein
VNSRTTDSSIHQSKLRFFDLDADIRSDSSAYIDLFDRMYRRFRAPDSRPSGQRQIEFTVLTRPDNRWGHPMMILDDEPWPIRDPAILEGYTYEVVLNAILASVRSHFLIHAGVVARDDRGIVLAADSAHGKTTLVLELVRRGWKFLSDEMAALGRADGRVHPFPRSLRIRPGTLELAGFSGAADGAPQWLDKLLLDINEIQPGSMGRTASVSQVVILRDPSTAQDEDWNGAERELTVSVDRLDEDLIAAIRQIEGVAEAQPDVDCGYPAIKLRTADRSRLSILSQIEALCQERRTLVLDVVKRTESRPTFAVPARLQPIPRSKAVLELLRRFQGGHKSALLQKEFDGSSTRLFMELAGIIEQADCYQLFVGPLGEMADLICDLAC